MGPRPLLVVLASALAIGGSSPSLLEQAIRARGGPLAAVVRSVEAEVYGAPAAGLLGSRA